MQSPPDGALLFMSPLAIHLSTPPTFAIISGNHFAQSFTVTYLEEIPIL
jgi:hypothetical protein